MKKLVQSLSAKVRDEDAYNAAQGERFSLLEGELPRKKPRS